MLSKHHLRRFLLLCVVLAILITPQAHSFFITQWINLISHLTKSIVPQSEQLKENFDNLNNLIRKIPSLKEYNIPLNF